MTLDNLTFQRHQVPSISHLYGTPYRSVVCALADRHADCVTQVTVGSECLEILYRLMCRYLLDPPPPPSPFGNGSHWNPRAPKQRNPDATRLIVEYLEKDSKLAHARFLENLAKYLWPIEEYCHLPVTQAIALPAQHPHYTGYYLEASPKWLNNSLGFSTWTVIVRHLMYYHEKEQPDWFTALHAGSPFRSLYRCPSTTPQKQIQFFFGLLPELLQLKPKTWSGGQTEIWDAGCGGVGYMLSQKWTERRECNKLDNMLLTFLVKNGW